MTRGIVHYKRDGVVFCGAPHVFVAGQPMLTNSVEQFAFVTCPHCIKAAREARVKQWAARWTGEAS